MVDIVDIADIVDIVDVVDIVDIVDSVDIIDIVEILKQFGTSSNWSYLKKRDPINQLTTVQYGSKRC